mgnify:CR=1 FL=1|jgi:hypothetical protein
MICIVHRGPPIESDLYVLCSLGGAAEGVADTSP